MFFDPSHFNKINITPELKVDVAKAVEETILASCAVMYGRIIDGKWINFTNKKKPQDTHICYGVLPGEMGSIPPHEEYGK